jgi:hypothetical protein
MNLTFAAVAVMPRAQTFPASAVDRRPAGASSIAGVATPSIGILTVGTPTLRDEVHERPWTLGATDPGNSAPALRAGR